MLPNGSFSPSPSRCPCLHPIELKGLIRGWTLNALEEDLIHFTSEDPLWNPRIEDRQCILDYSLLLLLSSSQKMLVQDYTVLTPPTRAGPIASGF